MQKTIRLAGYSLLTLFLFGLLNNSAHAFTTDEKAPSTLDKYDLVARGKMSQDRGLRPVQVARMDNNGEILFSCIEAKNREELKSKGIKCQQSQLELLVDWNLLKFDRKSKTYETMIHVYGAEISGAIRQLVNTGVMVLAETLHSDLASLKSHLAKIGREKSLFAILYGYVLHSYAMTQFGEEIYRKPQLSAEHPFWNGYAWAIFPAKKYPTSVTFMPVERNQFYFISASGVPRLDFRQITAFVKDVATDNTVDDPELKKSLLIYGLFDKEGKLTIPILMSEWFLKLESMAKKVYAKTIELADSEKMKGILEMETQAQAAMFLHYEIRNAFLEYLLEQGMIEAPVDFNNPDNNSPANMRNLIFLMITDKQN